MSNASAMRRNLEHPRGQVGINLPMNKHTAASINISVLFPICAGIVHIILPVVQPLLDKGVALGKPLDEVLIINIVNRDVQMLVPLGERRVIGKIPNYNGDYVGDVAVGQGFWTSK